MPVRACIFDLDGVIADTSRHHFLAWGTLAESLGIPFDERDNDALKGVSRLRSLELILEKSDRSYSPAERDAFADRKNAEYRRRIAGISPADVLPGVHDALAWLRARGTLTGLASASKNAAFVIERLGLENMFDYVADANLISNGKPAPDIFLDVARALKTDPANCIAVEDAAAGVQAIKAAGMFAIGVGDPAILHQADVVWPGLDHADFEGLMQGGN
ncbi:MAG: beta-phosphoglucomutase [Sphingomonadales bacterium]